LVIIIRYPASPSRIIVLLKTSPLLKKNPERKEKNEKKEKREKKGTRIDHMTERKRRQNLAKCCSVSLQS